MRYKVQSKDVRKSLGADLEGAEKYASKDKGFATTALGVHPSSTREHALTDEEIAAKRVGVTVEESRLSN